MSVPPSPQLVSALGLDVGHKRVGVAGCDGLGLMATGLMTLKRSSFEQDVAQLQKLVVERRVQVLVVGLPYSMDGSIGPQAKKVQRYAKGLSQSLELPLEYIDERLTSVQAEQILRDANIAPSRNKAMIDAIAAAIILQQWLDQRRGSH